MFSRSSYNRSAVSPRKSLTHKGSTTKSAHFDEENLKQTFHPSFKTYGFMHVNESKTPFPRSADPVDADLLRERLQATLEQANELLPVVAVDFTNYSPGKKNSAESSTSDQANTRDTFSVKRKKFYASEYAIAKQHHTSDSVHPPASNIPIGCCDKRSLKSLDVMRMNMFEDDLGGWQT